MVVTTVVLLVLFLLVVGALVVSKRQVLKASKAPATTRLENTARITKRRKSRFLLDDPKPFLRKTPLRALVDSVVEFRSFEAGEVMFRSTDFATSFLVVCRGEAALYCGGGESDKNDDVRVGSLRVGDCSGHFFALCQGGTRHRTAVAVTDVLVAELQDRGDPTKLLNHCRQTLGHALTVANFALHHWLGDDPHLSSGKTNNAASNVLKGILGGGPSRGSSFFSSFEQREGPLAVVRFDAGDQVCGFGSPAAAAADVLPPQEEDLNFEGKKRRRRRTSQSQSREGRRLFFFVLLSGRVDEAGVVKETRGDLIGGLAFFCGDDPPKVKALSHCALVKIDDSDFEKQQDSAFLVATLRAAVEEARPVMERWAQRGLSRRFLRAGERLDEDEDAAYLVLSGRVRSFLFADASRGVSKQRVDSVRDFKRGDVVGLNDLLLPPTNHRHCDTTTTNLTKTNLTTTTTTPTKETTTTTTTTTNEENGQEEHHHSDRALSSRRQRRFVEKYAARDSEVVVLARTAVERLLPASCSLNLVKRQLALKERKRRSNRVTLATVDANVVCVLPTSPGAVGLAKSLGAALASPRDGLELDSDDALCRVIDADDAKLKFPRFFRCSDDNDKDRDSQDSSQDYQQNDDDFDDDTRARIATTWLAEVERAFRRVVLVADCDVTQWTRIAVSSADAVLFVASAEDDDEEHPCEPSRPERELFSLVPGAAPRQLLAVCHRNGTTSSPRNTRRFLLKRPRLDEPRVLHLRYDDDDDDDDDSKPVTFNSSDVRRASRFLTGCARGLVLGGGGARGLAHLGALKSLAAAGVEIDCIMGCSQGAMIGLLTAKERGWPSSAEENNALLLGGGGGGGGGFGGFRGEEDSHDEQKKKKKNTNHHHHHIRGGGTTTTTTTAPPRHPPPMRTTLERARSFASKLASPWMVLRDLNLVPFFAVSTFSGKEFAKAIASSFDDPSEQMEDSWIPRYCVSTDVTSADARIHGCGDDAPKSCLASMTLVGYFPPVIADDGHLLVDGGYACNLPVSQMRQIVGDRGVVCAVDVEAEPDADLLVQKKPRDWRRGLSGLASFVARFFDPHAHVSLSFLTAQLLYIRHAAQLRDALQNGAVDLCLRLDSVLGFSFLAYDQLDLIAQKAQAEAAHLVQAHFHPPPLSSREGGAEEDVEVADDRTAPSTQHKAAAQLRPLPALPRHRRPHHRADSTQRTTDDDEAMTSTSSSSSSSTRKVVVPPKVRHTLRRLCSFPATAKQSRRVAPHHRGLVALVDSFLKDSPNDDLRRLSAPSSIDRLGLLLPTIARDTHSPPEDDALHDDVDPDDDIEEQPLHW